MLENRVTEPEFERAVAFLVGIGQATGEKKNEVILASDLLGVSTLVALLNNPGAGGHDSDAALLGPFWRANAPVLAPGACIACADTSAQGTPLAVDRPRARCRRPADRRRHGRRLAGRRRWACTRTRTRSSPT